MLRWQVVHLTPHHPTISGRGFPSAPTNRLSRSCRRSWGSSIGHPAGADRRWRPRKSFYDRSRNGPGGLGAYGRLLNRPSVETLPLQVRANLLLPTADVTDRVGVLSAPKSTRTVGSGRQRGCPAGPLAGREVEAEPAPQPHHNAGTGCQQHVQVVADQGLRGLQPPHVL